MFFNKKKKEGPLYPSKNGMIMYIKSDRGTLIRSFLIKGYDFQINYDEGAPILLEKEMIGQFPDDKITVHIDLDGNYRVLSSEIHGGHFLTPQEYEELLKLKEEQK
jgi:hypothetical protein